MTYELEVSDFWYQVAVFACIFRLPGYAENEWIAELDATNLQPGASPNP